MNRKIVVGALCDERPVQGTVYRADQIQSAVDALGEGTRGVRYVGIGSEKAAFIYGNRLCLKLQTSTAVSMNQLKTEVGLLERIQNGPYSDVVPKIVDRNDDCTSMLCEACGVCDDRTWRRIFKIDRWQSYLFIQAIMLNFPGKKPSDIFWNSALSLDEIDRQIENERDCWDDSISIRNDMYRLLTSKTVEGIHLLKLLDVLKIYELTDYSTDGNIGIAMRNGKRLPVIVDLGL